MQRPTHANVLTPQDVPAWLDKLGIRRVLVLSPHLDDAVFSLASLLQAAADRATVVTVFTDAEPGPGEAWTHMAGFSGTQDEFSARRAEDADAMGLLGCAFLHAGLRSGQLNDALAHTLTREWLDVAGMNDAHGLVLLPAAAGSHLPYTPLQAFWNRLTRRPFGAPAHGEHRQVRDHFWSPMTQSHCQMGFYAELPYVWKQGDLALERELRQRFGQPLKKWTIQPDMGLKLPAALCYASQMPLVFGHDQRYRQRALGRQETLFLNDMA